MSEKRRALGRGLGALIPSGTATADRPVASRAILTAFSTASAPELNSADRFSWPPGVRRASSSHTATYPS